MCGSIPIIGDIFGKDTPPPPEVVRQSPLADQAALDSAASARAATSRLDKRRRMSGLSLLASGASGDTTSPVTGKPAAAAGVKTKLGQ